MNTDVSIRSPRIGVVAIGRNEGERLRRCLASLAGHAGRIVYVDSASTDGSSAIATAAGAEVVHLDMNLPFTAARARNAGFERLLVLDPEVELVQFVDGDCEVEAGWWVAALAAMASQPQAAVVCGRRRERHPEASIYNRLCDVEWNTPVGEALECGGDALIRTRAFREVAGYNPALIAGEEPDMCVRMRQRGWKIFRIDAAMTLHDAAMTRFGQWWRRELRGGHAAAEGAAMHGHPPERHRVRECRRNWFWGAALPVAMLAWAWPTHGLSMILLLLYPVLVFRIDKSLRRRSMAPADARLYALFCALSKFPQAIGQARYWLGRMTNRPSRLIEYKASFSNTRSGQVQPQRI